MMLRRTIHPEVKVLDSKAGLAEYVASDETLDRDREVIRSKGWRFSNFKRNAPFVDSHDYSSIDRILGKVVDFEVKDGRLVETVQWAVDVPENRLAQMGWKMTEGGYLKAVSVGFKPVRMLTRDGETTAERKAWRDQLEELGLTRENQPRRIFLEQEQFELSACVVGANPNALAVTAKCYKAGVVSDADLEWIYQELTKRETASAADEAADVALARQRQREEFLEKLLKG